jgi:hypothetical protein
MPRKEGDVEGRARMAREELNKLLSALLPYAQQELAKSREFYPFGATMARDGAIALVRGQADDEHPSSQALIDNIVANFQSMAASKEIIAAGVCFAVRVTPPGQPGLVDAICTRLEHSDGEALDVLLPYNQKGDEEITYGALFAVQGSVRLFK